MTRFKTSGISPRVAYFSMEVGIDPGMPTYSGGLGVLAGDTLRAAADLAVPMVGITLLHRKGYFRQYLDAGGNQGENPVAWAPKNFLQAMKPHVAVNIEGRRVLIRAWRYLVQGVSGFIVPVYFLDTALPENSPEDQVITDHLYGGDERYRLCQEVVLGMGGVVMLRALKYTEIQTYHMNEGHSALLVLALLNQQTQSDLKVFEYNREAIRQRCVFTTHTPVPAGHDSFSLDLTRHVLGEEQANVLTASGCCPQNT
ncbi:MAG: alpha-glucan family phosphorylase, partial [Dehalococcoidia bacterium]|nr:alpha-glucan family phosphorylase [Dehalococcoidia bacterium]